MTLKKYTTDLNKSKGPWKKGKKNKTDEDYLKEYERIKNETTGLDSDEYIPPGTIKPKHTDPWKKGKRTKERKDIYIGNSNPTWIKDKLENSGLILGKDFEMRDENGLWAGWLSIFNKQEKIKEILNKIESNNQNEKSLLQAPIEKARTKNSK